MNDHANLDAKLETGLLFGWILNGKGGGRAVAWPEARDWVATAGGETLWLHMDRTVDGIDDWLEARFNMSEATADALISNETRPRAFREVDALVAILRGMNLNEGADPDDMIALQIWATQTCVISLRRRFMQSPRQVLADLEAGQGPLTAGDLLTELAERLVVNMSIRIVAMNTQIDDLEATLETGDVEEALTEIGDIRRSCLAMKRYMSPQLDALVQISRAEADVSWMSPRNQRDVREIIERLQRYLDDIDVSKESAIVLQDDLNNRATQQTNKTMYMLSIVAAIFLPLGFLTGLLGINVGGMPGTDSDMAFWGFVIVLMMLMGLQYYIFKRLKWL